MPNLEKLSKCLLVMVIVVVLLRFSIFSLRFLLRSNYPLVTVEGESMVPTYLDGDLLVVRGVEDKQSLKPGEVIVFLNPKPPPTMIVHRIIQVVNESSQVEFVTKGDNNPNSDYNYWGWMVSETDIVGVVIVKLPPIASSIVIAIENPTTTVFVVVITIVVIGLGISSDGERYKMSSLFLHTHKDKKRSPKDRASECYMINSMWQGFEAIHRSSSGHRNSNIVK